MRNRDEKDIQLLKVELNKLTGTFKKYKENVSLEHNSVIQMPERFLTQFNANDSAIVDT